MITAESIELGYCATEGQSAVHLPLGLLGFEHIKRYVLVSESGEEPFRWLQVPDDAGLAFLVVSPFDVRLDYHPAISQEDVEFLELAEPADALIYNIVTLRAHNRATVNLKGPVVLNRHTLRGKQVVITNARDYALQHPLPLME